MLFFYVVALGGAHLAAERSEWERSGAKWRGRGIGQRNFENSVLIDDYFFKNLSIILKIELSAVA